MSALTVETSTDSHHVDARPGPNPVSWSARCIDLTQSQQCRFPPSNVPRLEAVVVLAHKRLYLDILCGYFYILIPSII